MSVKASTWAWEQRIPPYDKLVLLELADHSDDKGRCWPKQETIAIRTGINRTTVSRAIKRMVTLGLLTYEQRKRSGLQRSNMYTLNIGIMIIPCDSGHHGCDDQEHTTVVTSATHIETSVETSVETSTSGEPQEDDEVKILEAISGMKKEKAEIFKKAKRKDGILTAKSCTDLWRDCRASAADDNGFQAELTNKDMKMLRDASIRIGESFPEVVWKCMKDWVPFIKHARSTAGAFPLPTHPKIWFFVKYIEAAADFTPGNKKDADFGVQLTAPEKTTQPLTKEPKASKKIKISAETIAETIAIGEKFGL